ncbi:hypothetical protein [Micromonospora wenchangensis]|uniref:hypothetical protein n=1 Tax=Micromonospora wenchangensis TaxID=1185415 RepID=UPI0037F9A7EE
MVHTVGLQAFLSGVWTDIPLMATPVTVTRGLEPYGTWPRPSSFRCEINNDSLDYDPSRPTSLLYGIAGRNTRMRIRPNGANYLYAEATAWTPERTIDHQPGAQRGRSTTALSAEGLLRRIGTWTDPIRSPMYRTISGRSTSIGHWSLEDAQGVLALSNSLAGGQLGQLKGSVTLGASESPQGAASSAQVADGSRMSGRFAPASTTAGWQVAWSFRLPAIPTAGTVGELIRWTTSNGYTWAVELTNGDAYRTTVTAPDGTSLLSYSLFYGAGRDPARWITMRVKVSASGGTVTVEPAWYAQNDTVTEGGSSTFAGTVGALDSWTITGGAVTAGGWYSHVFGVTTTADNLVGAVAQVFNGYNGESAESRFLRLMAEQGLTRYVINAGLEVTMPMGPQRPGTLLDLLREIRDTDDCRIDDERFDIALTMTPRRALLNQTPALALTYPDDIYSYEKEIGDLNTHNRVTVKNTSGGEVTVSLETGPMSVQPPPAGVGLNAATVGVNLADEGDLPDVASWHLAKGTLETPLYRSIGVNLTARPSLTTAAAAVRAGSCITVTGIEAEPVYLLVVGINRTTRPGMDVITFSCEPYEPYQVGVWDSPSFRYDSRTSTLGGSYSASATSMVVTHTKKYDDWSTTATPYEWLVGGERIRVTAMGAVTGSGPWSQTATVVRAVNGVSKAQSVGTAVHLADAKRWGL